MKRKATDTSNNIAVVYARFSSKNQRAESIDAQVCACREYAARNGLEIVKIYADSAKSGTTAEREAFLEMIHDCDKGAFGHLIVHKLDRFSRDKHDAVIYKHKLKQNGVRLHSACERLDDSPESVILESLLEGMNQYYSANLAREVKKGMFESAKKGTHLGGFAPLGYDVDPVTKRYVVNEAEAALIRTIFEQYADGVGYNKLVDYLNGMGYRTKRGNPFGKNSLNSILKNEKYVGRFTFNKMLEKDVSKRRNPQLRPREEWIIVENGLPAIVSQEIFDKVQARILHNLRSGGAFKAKVVYLLSGLIVCGECGASLCGNNRKCGSRATMYASYRCSNRANHRGCLNKEIHKEYIESYVLDELYKKLFSETSIRQLSTMLSEYSQAQTMKTDTALQDAYEELEKTIHKISTVIRLVSESGVSIETVKEELKRLEDRKLYLEALIQESNVKANASSALSKEMIVDLIKKSSEFVRTRNIPECKNFINSYIEQVVVYGDRVEVVFKVHVPDAENDSIVPLKSGEEIQAIREEYGRLEKSA